MASDEVTPPAVRISVVGAWAGCLVVELGACTVPMLRAVVARRAGNVEPDRVGLILGGRVLKDDPPASLQQAGLNSNSMVLSTLASADRGKAIAAEAVASAGAAAAEEEHASRLVRLWHSDGSFPEEDFNLDLEDQSDQKGMMFGSVGDIKAVKMDLMLPPAASSQYPALLHADLSGSTVAGTSVVRGTDGVTKQPKSEKKLQCLVGCVFILAKLADLKEIHALLPERTRIPDKAAAIIGAIFALWKILYDALKDTKEFCELIHYVRELCKKDDTA